MISFGAVMGLGFDCPTVLAALAGNVIQPAVTLKVGVLGGAETAKHFDLLVIKRGIIAQIVVFDCVS